MSRRRLSSPLLIAILSALLGAAVSHPLLAQSQERPLHAPDVGLVCRWAMLNAAAEAGRQCRPGQNPAIQAELDRSVRRLDDYVLRNSPMTPAAVAQFKADQANTGNQEYCSVAVGFFEIYAQAGPDRLRRELDTFLSGRPPVEWGMCL